MKKQFILYAATGLLMFGGCKDDSQDNPAPAEECAQTLHETTFYAKIGSNTFQPTAQLVKKSTDSCGVSKVHIIANPADTIKNAEQAGIVNAAMQNIKQVSDKVAFGGAITARTGLTVNAPAGIEVNRYTPANPADTTPSGSGDPQTPDEPAAPPVNQDSIDKAAACAAKSHPDSSYTWNAAQKKCEAAYTPQQPPVNQDSVNCAANPQTEWVNGSCRQIDKPDTVDLTTATFTARAQPYSDGFSGQKTVDLTGAFSSLPDRTGKTPNVVFVNSTLTGDVTYVIKASDWSKFIQACDPAQAGDTRVVNKQNGNLGDLEVTIVKDLTIVNENLAKKWTAAAVKVNKPDNFFTSVDNISAATVTYDVRANDNSNKVTANGDKYLFRIAPYASTQGGYPILTAVNTGAYINSTLTNDAFLVLDNSSTWNTNSDVETKLGLLGITVTNPFINTGEDGISPLYWKKKSDVIADPNIPSTARWLGWEYGD